MTRARLILALADGWTYREISQRLGCTAPVITLWRRRFAEQSIGQLCALIAGAVLAGLLLQDCAPPLPRAPAYPRQLRLFDI